MGQLQFWMEDEDNNHTRGTLHVEQTEMSDPQGAQQLEQVMVVAIHAAVLP